VANAEAGILVCDVTRRETFENVKLWWDEIKKEAEGIKLILVGNKIDLVDSSQVSLNPNNLAYNGKPEHSDLWTIEFTQRRFQQFLEEGGMYNPQEKDKLVEAPDHLLGGIELLLKNWSKLT